MHICIYDDETSEHADQEKEVNILFACLLVCWGSMKYLFLFWCVYYSIASADVFYAFSFIEVEAEAAQ